jgi:hypothetical protein
MKIGDLVKHVFKHKNENISGVLFEEVCNPRGSTNNVFNVLWSDGEVWNNVWDYDLKVINGVD